MVSEAESWAIDLRHITKLYRRRVWALRGVNMQVRRGEIFGLLGPNGAGKSTLVKIMMTVVRPTSAQGTVLGRQVGHKPTLARLGYLPENHRFPRYLTGRQTVELFAALAGVDRPTRRRRTAELLDIVGMGQWANTRIGQYSKGMMQRIGLAQALVNDPDLVILDEPTDGVDPGGRRDIRDVLLRMKSQGRTIFINSHLLSELESVCDRVAILVQGMVAKQGTIDELTEAKQCYLIEVAPDAGTWPAMLRALPGVFDATAPPPIPPPPAGAMLQYRGRVPIVPPQPATPPARGTLAGGVWCAFDGAILRLGTTEPADVQSILDSLRREGIIIRRMHLHRPSLEELFFEAVTDPSTGGLLAPGATSVSPGHLPTQLATTGGAT